MRGEESEHNKKLKVTKGKMVNYEEGISEIDMSFKIINICFARPNIRLWTTA